MKHSNRFLFSIFFFFTIIPQAAIADGSDFIKDCKHVVRYVEGNKSGNEASIGTCLGLVKGVMDTVRLYNAVGVNQPSLLTACFPEGVSTLQVVIVLVRYLEKILQNYIVMNRS